MSSEAAKFRVLHVTLEDVAVLESTFAPKHAQVLRTHITRPSVLHLLFSSGLHKDSNWKTYIQGPYRTDLNQLLNLFLSFLLSNTFCCPFVNEVFQTKITVLILYITFCCCSFSMSLSNSFLYNIQHVCHLSYFFHSKLISVILMWNRPGFISWGVNNRIYPPSLCHS